MAKPMKVLFVEDDCEDVLLMETALKTYAEKFSLQVCKNGEEAMKYLHNVENPLPDIILLDLNLPKVNGHQVLQDVKSTPRLKSVPVLVFSTTTDVRDIERITPYNGTSFAAKPADFKSYKPVVESMQKICAAPPDEPSIA